MLSNYRCFVTSLIDLDFWGQPQSGYALSFNCKLSKCVLFFFSFVALLFFFFPFNVSLYDHIPGWRRRCVLLHGRYGHVSQLVFPPSAGRSAHSRLGFVANQQLLCLPWRVSLWKCSRKSSSDRERKYDGERSLASYCV